MMSMIGSFLNTSRDICKDLVRRSILDVEVKLTAGTSQKIIRWKDGTIYYGQCSANIMEGNGKLVFPNGDFYEG